MENEKKDFCSVCNKLMRTYNIQRQLNLYQNFIED